MEAHGGESIDVVLRCARIKLPVHPEEKLRLEAKGAFLECAVLGRALPGSCRRRDIPTESGVERFSDFQSHCGCRVTIAARF